MKNKILKLIFHFLGYRELIEFEDENNYEFFTTTKAKDYLVDLLAKNDNCVEVIEVNNFLLHEQTIKIRRLTAQLKQKDAQLQKVKEQLKSGTRSEEGQRTIKALS